jgi:Holliday junction DNA helicase RuvB
MGRGPFKTGEFVGQKKAIRFMRRVLGVAGLRKDVYQPTIIAGPTGLGKTELVKHLAAALGIPFKKFIVTCKTSVAMLKAELLALDYFDMVLFDEAHNLTKECQEFFYSVLEDWKFVEKSQKTDGKGGPEAPRSVSVAKVNLFFATDQPGALEHALLRRLYRLSLVPYEPEEIRSIIIETAKFKGIPISPQGARLLASVSKQSPGEAVKLLSGLWSWHETDDKAISEAIVREFFVDTGIDEQTGLSADDKRYLKILASMPTGRATLNHLTALMLAGEAEITRHIEPFLLLNGYLQISSNGRQVTEKSKKYLEGVKDGDRGDKVEDVDGDRVPSEPTDPADR